MTKKYSILIQKDTLCFTASHWVRYRVDGKIIVESPHEHTFRVTVKISGPLDENGLLLDFVMTERSMREILQQLDHKILVPEFDPEIQLTKTSQSTQITINNRQWEFLQNEILLLPLKNTSTELIASWILDQLVQYLTKKGELSYPNNRYRFQLILEEETGCFVECTKQAK